MKKRGIFSVFLLSVLLLNASLLLLWVVFYYLTAGMVQRNMRLQAETGSEVIISSMERELLAMENTAYELGHDEELADLIGCTEPLAFYDSCNAYLDAHPLSSGDLSRDNALIVFNTEGLFYRLRGNISNTTLKRCFYLMESGGGKGFTVTSNDNSYIASYESIRNGRDRAGYVLMLMDQQRIESFLTAYDDLDYLGVALLSGDRILCSNKELRAEDISGLSENAVFVKEKEVGISGLRLLVWCEKGISARMAAYFRIVGIPAFR